MDKTNLSDKRSLVLLRKLEGSWDGSRGTLLGAGTNVYLYLGGGFTSVHRHKNPLRCTLQTVHRLLYVRYSLIFKNPLTNSNISSIRGIKAVICSSMWCKK